MFKDLSGRAWTLAITLPVLERVKEFTGMQLMQLFDSTKGNAIEDLRDPVELLRVLIAIVEPEKQGVSIEQFKVSISDGDVLEQAADALLDELVDFLPLRQRSLRRTAISKLREVKPAQYEVAERAMQAAMIQMSKSIEQLQSFDFSTNSPVSPASIPEPTVSPN